jgi:hypothetical protein
MRDQGSVRFGRSHGLASRDGVEHEPIASHHDRVRPRRDMENL